MVSYGTGIMQLVFQCHVKFSTDLVDRVVMVEFLATHIILLVEVNAARTGNYAKIIVRMRENNVISKQTSMTI